MGMKGNLAAALAQALNERPDTSGITEVAAFQIVQRMFALARTDSCFVKAAADEPIFVLRAQDRTAPGGVRDWAQRAKNAGMDDEKFTECMDHAREMEDWGKTHFTKVPD